MKRKLLLILALCCGLLAGIFYWRSHRASLPAAAAVKEYFRLQSPADGWILNQVQERNVSLFEKKQKSPLQRLKSTLTNPDSSLDWDKYVYGKGDDVITATVYHQRERMERVDLLGPRAPAVTNAFKARIESAFPGLPCRIVAGEPAKP